MTASLARQLLGVPTERVQPPVLRRHELTLAAVPSAVRCARMLVHQSLMDRRFAENFVQAVEEATDVLVMHAVEATGVTASGSFCDQAFDHLRLLVVRLEVDSERVIVEVWDRSNQPPDPRLGAVRAIRTAEQWGYGRPARGQRVVWCTVAMSPDKPGLVLPRRVPRPVPRTPRGQTAERLPDLELLQRLRDCLDRLGTPGSEAHNADRL